MLQDHHPDTGLREQTVRISASFHKDQSNEPINHLDRKKHGRKSHLSLKIDKFTKPVPFLPWERPPLLCSHLLTTLCLSCLNSFDGYHEAQETRDSPDGGWSGVYLWSVLIQKDRGNVAILGVGWLQGAFWFLWFALGKGNLDFSGPCQQRLVGQRHRGPKETFLLGLHLY